MRVEGEGFVLITLFLVTSPSPLSTHTHIHTALPPFHTHTHTHTYTYTHIHTHTRIHTHTSTQCLVQLLLRLLRSDGLRSDSLRSERVLLRSHGPLRSEQFVLPPPGCCNCCNFRRSTNLEQGLANLLERSTNLLIVLRRSTNLLTAVPVWGYGLREVRVEV